MIAAKPSSHFWPAPRSNQAAAGHRASTQFDKKKGTISINHYRDNVMVWSADGTFYQCDLDGGNRKELFSDEKIYNIIVTQDDIYYSTVDKDGYTQTFAYSFSEKKADKIATSAFPITGYSDSVLYCGGTAGFGYLCSLDCRTGEQEVFDYRVTD